jgi:hypothetical protein
MMRKGMRSLTTATGNTDYLEAPLGVNDLQAESLCYFGLRTGARGVDIILQTQALE